VTAFKTKRKEKEPKQWGLNSVARGEITVNKITGETFRIRGEKGRKKGGGGSIIWGER